MRSRNYCFQLLTFVVVQWFCLVFISQGVAEVNHSGGLHLQLPNQLIDFKLSDIENLEIVPVSKDLASIMLRFNSVAADRLYKLTQNAVGQTAVWIFDGRVLGVEKLQAPISYDLTVHNFKQFEAEDFKKMKSNA